jgi:hypothetical protein
LSFVATAGKATKENKNPQRIAHEILEGCFAKTKKREEQ